jgi:hypothetical protein
MYDIGSSDELLEYTMPGVTLHLPRGSLTLCLDLCESFLHVPCLALVPLGTVPKAVAQIKPLPQFIGLVHKAKVLGKPRAARSGGLRGSTTEKKG